MKKTKKLTSMALALVMAGAMLPGAMLQNVSAATATNTNADIYTGKTCVTSSNMEDFEGFEVGTTWTANADGSALTNNISRFIDVKITGAGNKAEIVEDNGSKVLKVTYVGSGRIDLYNYFTSNHSYQMSDQIVRAGVKARFESFTEEANITNFNKMYNQTKGTQIGMLVCGKGKEMWINQYDPARGKQVEDDLTKYKDKYFSVASTYNRTTKLGTVEAPRATYTWQGSSDYWFHEADFTITTANGSYKGFDSATDASGNKVNTVLYFDDIFFERISYSEVTVGGVFDQGKTITNVPLNAPINVKLNDVVSGEHLGGKYFTFTDSKGNAVDFDIEKESDNIFTVYPKGQEISESYTLTVKSSFNNSISTDVKYTTCADGLEFKGYIENMSFDDLDDQSFSTGGKGEFLAGKVQVYSSQVGDSISVTTDPVTGSKALKLTRAKENLNGGLSKYNYIFNPVVESGKVIVNLDVRMVCDNGSATSFISFGDSKTTGSADSWTNRLNGNYWWRKASGTEQWTNKGDWDRNVYFPAMMSVDLESDTFRGQVYRKYGTSSQELIDANWTFEQSAEKNTSNIAYMNLIDFRSAVVGSTTEEINVYIDNLKIAHYDYQKLAVNSISKTQEKANVDGEIILTMNAEVADADVTTDNFMLIDMDGNPVEGYTVTKDANKIIIKAPTDLAYETGYFVTVKSGITSAIETVLPMESFYTYAFTTAAWSPEAWSPYVYEDNFEEFEIGQKWEGPQTAIIGNASVTLETGDSIEYALDEATGKVGFKLVKGTGTGNLDFKYIFPEGFTNGKYRVYVDERIENWSKAHNRWPALLNGNGTDNIGAGNRVTGSYWLEKSGNFKAQDRFGFDWGKWETENNTDSGRWISGYDMNSNYKVIGELTTGAGYNYGLENVETGVTVMGKIEPATTEATLGGVLMRINGGETDYSKAIYKGTQNTDDGVAWIYSIAVEKVALEVTGSSVESALDSFNPASDVTVSFNDYVSSATVNNNTFKLYKGEVLVEDYTVTLSEDKKTVTIEPAEGLLYNTEYKIVVEGVEGYDAVVGEAEAKTFTFKTLKKTGIEIDDIVVGENKITTTLYNYNEAAQSFATVGVVKYATGKILEIKFGNSGTVSAESTADLAVEFDNVGATYELFVWDGINTMKPLVKKK